MIVLTVVTALGKGRLTPSARNASQAAERQLAEGFAQDTDSAAAERRGQDSGPPFSSAARAALVNGLQ